LTKKEKRLTRPLLFADIQNMKRIILFCVSALWVTVFCAAQSSQVSGAHPFRQEGIASWYGAEFDGRPTASGEPFNSALLTAAHPSLPFGTVLKVTNKHNDLTVTVRVNDRGPFVAARIIDLSRAAAEVLDMLSTGTAPVTVEAVAAQAAAQAVPAREQAAPAVSAASGQAAAQSSSLSGAPASQVPAIYIIGAVPPAESAGSYRLQVGAYKIPRNAIDTLEKLKNAGLNPAYEKSGDLYRVVLPGLMTGDILPVSEKLKTAGFTQAIIWKE
jgi:rare lipoprotein A